MDDQEYKRLCAQPNVMSRSDIRATITRLSREHSPLASALKRVLASPSLPKPTAFQGGAESDYFYLDLSETEVEAIAEAIAYMEISLANSETDDPELGFVTGLHDKWRDAESSRPAV